MTQFTFYPEVNTDPVMTMSAPPENSVMLYSGKTEMLRIAKDGFYVRGEKVPADKKEAEEVYKAFKSFLVWHGLTRE